MTRAVVVGGGISGLSAALDLLAGGAEVSVLEAGPRTGGVLRAEQVGGIHVDVGAEAMLARRDEGTALARRLGLGELLVSPSAARPQLWRDGSARALPAGTVMGVPGTSTDLSGILEPDELLITEATIRAASHAARPQRGAARPLGDTDVAHAVFADVGRPVLELLVEPLLGGVYAGRTEQLSLAATVPALGRAWAAGEPLAEAVDRLGAAATPGVPVFTGLRGGMAGLAAAATTRLREHGAQVRCGVTVTGLHRGHTGWQITTGDGERISADVVVVALPAASAARLLGEAVPAAAVELADIPTASVAVVALALSGFDPVGSGLLVPPTQAERAGIAVKALTFSSAKWDWVGEQNRDVSLVRASVGRLGETAALQRSDTDLIDLVRHDLNVLLGRDVDIKDARVARWGGALPQYLPGHLERVARIRAAVAQSGGIGLAGAALDGVGVPACIGSGQAAARVALAG